MILPARIGVTLALAAGLALTARLGASADPLRDGTAAFANKDYAAAMPLLAPLADQGDPRAGCMVTVMRDKARGGVAYDIDDMAATCIAAAVGTASAELGLAGHYRTGLIVEKDPVKAAKLYRLAADQGLPIAQKVLGDLYASGAGVTADLAAACHWWGRAAMQGGSSEAQRDFGNCYLAGDGVPRSEMRALAWWLVARDNEDKNTDGLPDWVFQREAEADRSAEALLRRLPADQAAEAKAFARAWRPAPE